MILHTAEYADVSICCRCMIFILERLVNTDGQTTVAMLRTSCVVSKAPTVVMVDIAALMAPASAVSLTLISGASVSQAGEGHYATLVSHL